MHCPLVANWKAQWSIGVYHDREFYTVQATLDKFTLK